MVTDKLERLDFTIPEFFRTIWVSEQAKDLWEPRIQAIRMNWPYIERATVTQGLRDGVLQNIHPAELPEVQNWAFDNRVQMVILGMEGDAGLSYGNSSLPYQEGKPFTYRAYFGKSPEEFQKVWKEKNQLAIGRFLGYPPCCSKFFQKYWTEEGWSDLTYLSYEDDTKNLMYNNVLLRSLGVRAISHLPCSVTCKPSCKVGMDNFAVMKTCEHQVDIIDWMKTLLSMPMKWSSLHGIAILTTPLFKLINASDPLPSIAELKLNSDYYPEGGASANLFPFQQVRHLKFSVPKDSDFLDNGFGSRSSMAAAHKFVLSFIPKTIVGDILDLGCGNGRLLKEVQKYHPEVVLHGVDTKDIKDVKGWNFYRTNIYDFEWERPYEMTLMSVERLFETEPDVAIDLLQAIQQHSRYLLLSTYNKWMEGFTHIFDKLFTVVATGVDPALGYEAKLLERKI